MTANFGYYVAISLSFMAHSLAEPRARESWSWLLDLENHVVCYTFWYICKFEVSVAMCYWML